MRTLNFNQTERWKVLIVQDHATIYMEDRQVELSADTREELLELVSFILAPLGYSSVKAYNRRMDCANEDTLVTGWEELKKLG